MDDAERWAERQWGGVALGDRRRTRRVVSMGAAMATQPAAGLPAQMGDWAGVKAAYRLLERPEVTLAATTGPHGAATQRAATTAEGPVLFVHDDTVIDLSSHAAMTGRGRIGDDRGRGFMAHSCLALRPGAAADEVLGLAAMTAWARPAAGQAKGQSQAARQARRTEADVWAETVEAVGPAPAGATWVSVGDRGADIFSHLARARAQGWHTLVRIAQDRCLADGGHLVDRLRGLAPMARRRIPPPREEDRRPRQDTWADVAWAQVTVQPARHRPDRSPPIPCTAIRVWTETTEWLLLSTLPATDEAAVAERIDWYERRWVIEEFHKALKTGCRVEARQVRDRERFLPLLGLLAVVAVRLLQLRAEARRDPDAPSAEDPATVTLLAKAIGLPRDDLATRRGFHRGLARLGGFLARRGDGQPGWQTLWRGAQRLTLLLLGANLATHSHEPGSG